MNTHTVFSKWMTDKSIQVNDFAKKAGVPIDTIAQLAGGVPVELTSDIRKKLRQAIREVDPTANTYDFWQHEPDDIYYPYSISV